MKFADLANGTAVFVDANTFVYAFSPHAQLGPPSEKLLERIEHHELSGSTSTHVLSDVAHRLMTLEACAAYGWPFAGIAQRLSRHPAEVKQLSRYRQAIDAILAIGFQVLSSNARHIPAATAISHQHGLLTNDALIVALMQESGMLHLASNDGDFDLVAGITRYAPL